MSAFARPLLTISQLSVRSGREGGSWVTRLATTLQQWRRRSRERAMLAELSPRELADFGASTADVYRELNTPFWRAPPPC